MKTKKLVLAIGIILISISIALVAYLFNDSHKRKEINKDLLKPRDFKSVRLTNNNEFELLRLKLKLEKEYNETKHLFALALYFESGITSYDDKCAVAQVILNRVKSKKFPNTITEVILQDKQFSFDKSQIPDYKSKTWKQCLEIADYAMSNKLRNRVNGSLHYHATYVKPYWVSEMKIERKFQHIFYKSKS